MYALRKLIYCLFLVLFFSQGLPMDARGVIRGIVRDSISNEGLPFASIRIDDNKTTSLTDARGLFEINIPDNSNHINVYCQGYAPKSIPLRNTVLNLYDIMLSPASENLDELIVQHKKYSKKNNPAVDFVKRVKIHAAKSDPKNKDYYSFDRYGRVSLGIADFDTTMENGIMRRLPFLIEHIDTSEIDGKPVLNLSVKEKAVSYYFRHTPKSEKTIIKGVKSNGVDEFIGQENVQVLLDDILREINLYDNDIRLFRNSFVSPLSPIAPDFYRFYLVDSSAVLQENGPKHIVLAFYPRNKSSFGFKGHLYVDATDNDMFVRHIDMQVSEDINLNYIKTLKITQDFEKNDDGIRLKKKDNLFAIMQLMPNTPEMYISRKLSMSNYNFLRPEYADSIFSLAGPDITMSDSDKRDSIFWQEKRKITLQNGERHIDSLMNHLRAKPVFYWSEKILRILAQGYIQTGINSKFDYGPINTTASYNSLEGLRLRAGGTTTANLNQHLFARGYIAYGFRDKKWKYEIEGEYSFNKKKYHPNEFPIHSIKIKHSYDIDRLGAHYLYTNSDNFVLSLSRISDPRFTYQRLTSALYTLELNNHFSFKIGFEIAREEESPYVLFENSYGRHFEHYNERVITLNMRFAPGETFYQSRSQRIPVNREAPVIELSHRWAPKGFAGSTFGVNRTELALNKDFNLSILGHLETRISGGHVWCETPFPELFIPNANLSYTIQPQSFALMNPMEFINSSYCSLHLNWHLRGAIFNLVPGLKKLRFREIVGFSCLYGKLAEKCNPQNNKSLLKFPNNTDIRQMDRPYMEISAGIDNILTILRLEYYWRLTYRSVPYSIDKSGLRVALHFTF